MKDWTEAEITIYQPIKGKIRTNKKSPKMSMSRQRKKTKKMQRKVHTKWKKKDA